MMMLLVRCLIGLALTRLVHAAVLVDFQVTQPPPLPKDAQQCTIQLLQRTFGFSFGSPEIVQYNPPTDCGHPGSWAGVTLNMTVTSNGTQFDRLGIFTLRNVEIWRTSTPEPTKGDGIIWTYIKDVSRYIPLFAQPGTLILELNNLIQPGLDGQYATTVTATFYMSSSNHPAAKRANTIIPISNLSNSSANDASVPPGFSLNVTLPRNAIQIFAELYGSGNGDEEFWYYNAANEFFSILPANTTFPQGPFREVRFIVDGQVAGVVFPYATIFTGGIVPGAWRPITSYGALDLPTYFLDLTPFVPILTDGEPHNITLDVASAEADHGINNNWFVSGLLQVVTDPSSKPTTGQIVSYSADLFAQSTTAGNVSANGDVEIAVTARRQINIEAQILSGSGKSVHIVWSQNLEYSNTQTYLNSFKNQNVIQITSGSVRSTHNGEVVVSDDFSYPLRVNVTLLNDDGTNFSGIIDQSYKRTLLPSPLILESTIDEHQLAAATLISGSTGVGTNNNTFSYVDQAGNTYDRQVNAALSEIVFDHEGGNLAPSRTHTFPLVPQVLVSGEFRPVRLPGGRALGRHSQDVINPVNPG